MTASCFLDSSPTSGLYPLNLLRPETDLHFGVRSIAAQWQEALRDFPKIRIHPRLLPTADNVNTVQHLAEGRSLSKSGVLLAVHGKNTADPENWEHVDLLTEVAQLFERAGDGLSADLDRLKRAWSLRTLEENEREAWHQQGVIIHGPTDRIHLAPGVVLRDVSLNTEQGDIVMGAHAEVMEGARIRGPFGLGPRSVVRMGSFIYGPTMIGEGCKVGGEISNAVFHNWSNKAHGGFLGNAVIGSWCNLGAETTCSNLKNTYGDIEEWNDAVQKFQSRGRMFCGLVMGDHSKTAIHTAFNTATVVGACANVFGNGTPPRHVPSFAWGTEGHVTDLERALVAIARMMKRRNLHLTPEDEKRLADLHSTVSD